jgi:hypothetical protein
VFQDEKLVAEVGADGHHELDNQLEAVALRWCVPPRTYPLNEFGWRQLDRPNPRPAIAVAIWAHQRERWHHPGNKVMPADWDGALPLKVTTNVGSYRIE